MKRFLRPLSIIATLAVLITSGQGCLGGSSQQTTVPQVELTIWRVFDDKDTFDPIINAYRAQHPNVSINYRKLRYDEYEQELLRAFAEGNGPDILSVQNSWMREYQDLLMPMPSSVTVVNLEQRGTVRKEVVTVATEKPTMSIKTLNTNYVEVVPNDVVLSYQPDPRQDAEDRIYGLPLSVDTLALYYNKDLLDAAGIPSPATTWDQFQQQVTSLTALNEAGDVIQSGAALGTADNVERSADILSLLMLQTGTTMNDERGRVAFNATPVGADRGTLPGLNAVQFYTDFANPTKQVYTWNDSFPNSFDAFTSGKTAYFVGYSYHNDLIRTAAPKLNYGITQVPQIANSREVNFANYWVESVSAQTANPDWAWDFVLYAADAANVTSYLSVAKKPTALRSLINDQLEDETLGPFADQLLTAESWYKGRDVSAAEAAMRGLIDNILAGTYESPTDALDLAAKTVAQTY